jgi:hypothetical protein
MGHATSPMDPVSSVAVLVGPTDSRQPLNVAVFTGALSAGRSQGGGVNGLQRLEDPRQRPTAATMDPGTRRWTLPSLKARQKRPKRAWRHDQ